MYFLSIGVKGLIRYAFGHNLSNLINFQMRKPLSFRRVMTICFSHVCVWSQVMHGGLFSRDDVTLEELKTISRNRQPPDEGT